MCIHCLIKSTVVPCYVMNSNRPFLSCYHKRKATFSLVALYSENVSSSLGIFVMLFRGKQMMEQIVLS